MGGSSIISGCCGIGGAAVDEAYARIPASLRKDMFPFQREGVRQGLLVHFSAQRMHILRDTVAA